jgi:hypothetical protein
MTHLSDKVLELKIVADMGDKGGIVDMPVCRAATVDLKRTAGGGAGALEITVSMLEEMAANFALKPGPVPVYFGHENVAPRKPDTPAAGFVQSIWVDGDVLWNRIKFGPKAFDLIARQGGFAGASIEAEKDKTTPIADLSGWVETGLCVTNTPALDVQYLAASERDNGGLTIRSQVLAFGERKTPNKEKDMAVDVVVLEAKIADLEGKLALAAKKDAKILELEAQIRELEKRPTPEAIVALQAEITSIRQDQVKDQVVGIVNAAVAAGKPAAFFEGAAADPINYLKTRFSGSVAMLRASADALPVVVKTTPTSTQSGGNSLGDGSTPQEKLFAEIRKVSVAQKISFDAATNVVRDANPEMYRSGMNDYFATPLPGSNPSA